ncbi:MAG TPA: hypothetical protein VK150_00665, partial [Geothrix sp.]|nr:hypothetical protein [Geothrix sp.]
MIFVSALLLTALFATALYLQFASQRSLQHNRNTDQDQRQFRAELDAFDVALYEQEEGLYEYAVLMDDSQLERIRTAQSGTHAALGRLRELARDHQDQRIRSLV